MGTELAKAYVQIVPSAKGISGSISKELGREASVAGSSSGESFAGNMLGKVKQLIAVAGIGKVFSETISEGADLEQSLGGIETLFKESADKVKENAAKAYQTAGMSANEYMELTTSFSASLLSSLSNDTSKAADVADMAMTDMSDNANKMGTDMESIKNAYQGFAKQNYTMLDNLKLGYGGTKEEMQRLLTDAQKISGVKYDINNLSDVYNAIHVIQGQLDITGTTAKEASTTISGSLGSMKAAFKNVLGQITLGMDVGPALSALATTTTTFLVGNLLPAIWNILSGLPMALVTFIQTLIPQLIAAVIQFIPGILTAIQTGLPQLYEMANEILIQFTTAIQTNLPALLQQGVDIVTNIVNGILQNIPQMITMAGAAIANFENAIWSALPTVLTAGAQLLINLVNGIIQSLPGIVTAAAQAVAKMVVTIGQHLPEVLQTGIEIIGKLAAGLIRAIPTLLSKLPQIIKGIVNAFTEVDWLSIGINIIKGIGKGLANAGHMLWDAVKDILGNFKDKVLGFFGRWGAYVGEMIDLGMARGLINNSKPISDAVNMMQEVVKTPLESSASVSSDQQVAYTGTGIVERLDQLILILGMILNLLKMKDGNVSEREVVRVLREMGVVFS